MGNRTVICDVEADSLTPTKLWVICAKDVNSGEEYVFRRPDVDPHPFLRFASTVGAWVGHNFLGYDIHAINDLVPGAKIDSKRVIDTLVVSRLLDFNIVGKHSLRAWGERLGCPKTDFSDYSKLTEEMVQYCVQDVNVCHKVYQHFLPWINSPRWKSALRTEHDTEIFCSELKSNGFHFDIDNCEKLRYNILREVETLDNEIISAFPPKVLPIKVIEPRLTKFGTLNRSDFRWAGEDLSYFNGGPFTRIDYEDFNPGSPSQIVERLNEAGWKPVEKTKGHLQAIRDKDEAKIKKLSVTGWKVSEENLKTLPATAPPAAHLLAKRITAASRARTLKEWIDAYNSNTHRVHGSFNGIGAWTHRMSHDHPNTANIPTPQPINDKSSTTALWANAIDGRLRDLWGVPEGKWLVGVDAESIQLRILAHYIDDPRFTKALIEGDKKLGTDPHSLNKVALGSVCHSRAEAKTFIYAWLLGAGVGKVAEILGCSLKEAKQAVDNFIEFYPGLAYLKTDVIPNDAARGYFEGFDGRYVKIPGDDIGSRRHFALAGYLQNGESTIMKRAVQIWRPKLIEMKVPFKGVNFVHDEWQTETDTYENGLIIQRVQADAIRQVGEDLNLRCPMAGGVINSHDKIAIGVNWSETH